MIEIIINNLDFLIFNIMFNINKFVFLIQYKYEFVMIFVLFFLVVQPLFGGILYYIIL
jgi:hypothetical protein